MEMIVTVTQVHPLHSLYSWSVTQLTTLSSYSFRVSLTQCWRYWFSSCRRRLERELELESTLFSPCGWIISGWACFRNSYGLLSNVSQRRTKGLAIWRSVTKRHFWRQNHTDKPPVRVSRIFSRPGSVKSWQLRQLPITRTESVSSRDSGTLSVDWGEIKLKPSSPSAHFFFLPFFFGGGVGVGVGGRVYREIVSWSPPSSETQVQLVGTG